MSEAESRIERKERTRRALLEAALRLADESTLAGVSLRQMAKEVGIVPTAFYRHFASLDDVGLTLVDESFVSLRSMLREVRRSETATSSGEIVDHSLRILVEHVRRHREHFAFIARERVAGPPAVREAIRHEIELCERELATDLARLPVTQSWSADDLHVLAGLIVSAMVATAEELVAGRPDQETRTLGVARRRLLMILVGAVHWRSRG